MSKPAASGQTQVSTAPAQGSPAANAPSQAQAARPNPTQVPPVGTDPQLWAWFKAVDTDGSGFLSTEELQRALVNGDWTPFNIETVRLMVNIFDGDNTGTIIFPEFVALWQYIEDWKRIFRSFDPDNSGTISFDELKHALRAFGFNVSDRFIAILMKKYDKWAGTSKKAFGKSEITFDNFVQACVTVKTLTAAFIAFDTDKDGWIKINYEQFLELVANNR